MPAVVAIYLGEVRWGLCGCGASGSNRLCILPFSNWMQKEEGK